MQGTEWSEVVSRPHTGNSPNPLGELISDEAFARLMEHNLLSEKGLRDYEIRKAFRALRKQKIAANDAIEMVREQYPYLQFDTIRKIVYRV